MHGNREISLSQYTWALWKREAVAALSRSGRVAWFVSGVATAAAVWAGLSNADDGWRYSVVIYAPVIGYAVFEPTARIALGRMFRATGAAMRYRLVPALVPRASDAQLAKLAAHDAVSIGSQSLRAVDTGKEVVVSAGHPAGGYASDAAHIGEGGDSGDPVDLGGDFGGGFGGGGDGGGG